MSVSRLEDVLEQEMKLYQKDIKEAYRELRKYKLLEEELGIDLLTLFKALKDGIYSKQYGHLFVEHFVLKHDKELHCRPTYCAEIRFALKDYGKTWWLKEDIKDE